MQDREFFALVQILRCLLESFGIFDFCARNSEMWINLAAPSRSWAGQII
jgi:hypothetical protein